MADTVEGGKEVAIQVFKPKFHVDECLNAVRECLEKGWTGMGFKTVEFEEAWKKYTGHRYAYYINSNTAGLYMAVDTLKEVYGWKDGDEVISTPLTFISTNHAIPKSNLKAVFADVDDTLCLDPKSVEERITEKTRAVIFVGFGGNTGKFEKVCLKSNKNVDITMLDLKENIDFAKDNKELTGCKFHKVNVLDSNPSYPSFFDSAILIVVSA